MSSFSFNNFYSRETLPNSTVSILMDNKRELKELKKQVKALRKENKELKEEVEELKTDC